MQSLNEGFLQAYMRLGSLEGYIHGLLLFPSLGPVFSNDESFFFFFWSYCASRVDLKIGFVTKLYSGFRFFFIQNIMQGTANKL